MGEASEVQTIPLTGAPLVTIRVLGAALIEVTLAERADDPGLWKSIELERHALSANGASEVVQRDVFTKKGVVAGASQAGHESGRRALHTAKPGTTYGYRARSSGPWSEEVTLRVPRPTAPPLPPTALTARAESPFAVRVAWEGSARSTSGFEVQVKQEDDFVRAALVNPTEREYVHHLRVPGQKYVYRIRAFNTRGASTATAAAAITMPERVVGPGAKVPSMGPCIAPVRDAPKSTAGCNPGIDELDAGNGRVLQNVPGGGNGCRRRLIGYYEGCTREFGVFELQADVVVVPSWSDEGWPLLHAVAGAGQYVGAAIQTLRFGHGRYTVVDTAGFCGDRWPDADDLKVGVENADLALSFPPFEGCQSDFSL